jgi:hypothetical protein
MMEQEWFEVELDPRYVGTIVADASAVGDTDGESGNRRKNGMMTMECQNKSTLPPSGYAYVPSVNVNT